jgi:hypothetical protein
VRVTAGASAVRVTRARALGRVAMLYLAVQALSYAALQASCSVLDLHDTWFCGVLGPLAAINVVSRFRYHAWVSNAFFAGLCLIILAAPFAYVARPRRATLVVSVIGLVVWCLFGLGFSIDHM